MIQTYNEKRIAGAREFRSQLVRLLRENGPMTNSGIAKLAGRTQASVYANIKILEKEGMIRHAGHQPSAGSKQSSLFAATGLLEPRLVSDRVIIHARTLPQPFASMVAQMQVSQGQV